MENKPPSHTSAPPSALLVRQRFSLIWLIPIVAALVTGWLGFRTYQERGPTITITFETAEGLEAGRTKIKHKNVDLGTVEKVEPTKDLSHVIVTARMTGMAEPHLTEDTRFWVVRPRLSPEGVSGLGTLISGAYIEMEPGKGKTKHEFAGVETPPVVTASEPGTTYTLHAAQLGSVGQGTAVYFRGVKVGEVLGFDLSDTDGSATVHLFVHAPHDKLVHAGTRFWNASGIVAAAGSDGLKIQMESVQSLLAGGIAFDVPPKTEAGDIAGADTKFLLYPDKSTAFDAVYTRKIHFLLHFTDSVAGLAAGAQVRMQGLQVGEVDDVHIEYDEHNGRISVPVVIELQPDRITMVHGGSGDRNKTDAAAYDVFRRFIARGLRARTAAGNFLTGQKVVNLDFVPDAAPASLIEGGKYPEIPTLDSDDIDAVIHSAKELIASLQATVGTINKTLNSPEMAQSMHSLNDSLANLDRITRDASTRTGPLLDALQSVAASADSTLKQANTAMASGQGGGDLAGTLRELKDAARSVRVLADYLESHPDALLRGKTGSAKP